ncbi:MAG: hypothetical protein A2Y07_04335 [Planctomycetes bacterium GWF2_50_10]|nr:MAG: hypothetical protein A2Y07_04335 [Planctomycetes bacterium GWF2_50_10]
MIPNCLEYAKCSKSQGKPIIGVMCEYTPRELIMAAGCVPVCLCGGSAATISAAEAYLPGCLCPLIKSTFGYHVLKNNPFLEMADMIVAETTCDGKKKMYEIMGLTRPVYVLELPQKNDDRCAFNHWLNELQKFKYHLEKRFNLQITNEKLRAAITTMNQFRKLRREVAQLMAAEDPVLTGMELLTIKSSISAFAAEMEQYKLALDHFSRRKQNCQRQKPARVLVTGVPIVHGAEHVIDLIEQHGGLVVCFENCTGLKPVMEDVNENEADLMTALARKYFEIPCSVMTPNSKRLDLLRDLYNQYRPDCVIELVWQGCLTYDVESFHVQKLVRDELGIGYLRIVTDYSQNDSTRIAMRIDAMFETIRANVTSQ